MRFFFFDIQYPFFDIHPPIFMMSSVLFTKYLTPGILGSLNPLGGDFTRFHNYLNPYGLTFQPTFLRMIILSK
jgi:hypothetical protein